MSERWARARAYTLAAVTLTWICLTWFATDPWRVERLYVHGAGPWLAGLPNSVTRSLPFSAAEPFVVVGVVAILWWIVGRVSLFRQPDAPRWRLVVRTGSEVAIAAIGGLTLFHLVWGLSYSRPSLELRLGWTDEDSPELHIPPWELAELAEVLVGRVNDQYLALHGVPDAFVPTRPPPHLEVDRAVDAGWARSVEALGLDLDVARERGRSKRLVSSDLFSWLRISGMYFPFTGEANVNHRTPPWQQPFTIAHEKAHQRFMASENEANFHGMLACVHSEDPYVQYSGWLFAQRQVLRALQRSDPYTFVQLIQLRHPGVQRDVNAAHAFWSGYSGPLADLSRAVNDAYLRANRVRGGVKSYGRSLQLIVQHARNSDWPESPARR